MAAEDWLPGGGVDVAPLRAVMDSVAARLIASDPYEIGALDDPPPVAKIPPPTDPWLQRRALGWGASDVAALFVGYDLRDPLLLGDKARKNGHRFARGRWRLPRIVLEKAGAVSPLSGGGTPRAAGIARERALVEQWRRLVERGHAGPDAELVDPATVLYVPDAIPVELIPLVDRHEPLLCVSPDVFSRDVFGLLGCWDAKASVHGYADKRDGVPLEHVIQVNAQRATCGAFGASGIVEGCGWGATWRDHGGEPSGPIVTWAVERDEALIREIRQVVRHAWTDVLSVRAEMEGA